MNRWLKVIVGVFLYCFPVVIITASIDASGFEQWISATAIVRWILTAIILSWLLSGIILFGCLILSRNTRELLLTKLARIKERDEREEQIVARSSRASFLFTFAVLLAIGTASTFRYGHKIGSSDSSGKSITMGYFSWLEKRPPEIHRESKTDGSIETELFDLPLSKTGLIGLLLIAQLGSFWIFAQRAQKNCEDI